MFTIVMLGAGAWARDSIGVHTTIPMKMLSTTKAVKRGFDIRTLILMWVNLFWKQMSRSPVYGQRLFTVYPAAGPSSTAVPLLFIGTLTVTVTVVELPLLSVTLNVIV